MKVAITGHSRGIGAAIAKRFSDKDDTEILGFSRSNGFDLTNSKQRKFAIEEITDCDVFVNNFFYQDVQLLLLQQIFDSWLGEKDKYIINISSSSTYYVDTIDLTDAPGLHTYAKHKQKVDFLIRKMHSQTQHSWPIIFNIRPGYVDTDMVKHLKKKKMNTEAAADVIMYAFDNKDKFIIKDIVYEPF